MTKCLINNGSSGPVNASKLDFSVTALPDNIVHASRI